MNKSLFGLFGCLMSASLLAAAPPAAAFRAGAATSNVTPPLGGGIIGGFLPFPATHVHDELHARCLVLDDGHTKLALVVCDLLGLDYRLGVEARKLIQQNVGIPPEHVLISAVHTHSATSALGRDRSKFSSELNDYQSFVARRIADGVKCAANNLRPAQLAFVTAQAPEHVFNRRWFLKPGTIPPNPFGGVDQVQMNPPAGSPNLLQPAGPTDPTVSILSLREPAGRPIAVFAAYSLHYVGGVRGSDISADYYGMFCRRLERLLGAEDQDPPFVAMMANGTSGDVNNISFRKPRPGKEPYAQMRFVAEDVAGKVHAALAGAAYRDRVTLAARYREPLIACRRPTAEQIQWAKQTLARPAPPPGKVDLPYIYAQRTMSLVGAPEAVAAPLEVLRIGDVCIGTMPNEVFCEIGLEFRKRCPIQPAFLVSLAHGYFGYLPTPRQHALGGYETWLGTSRLEPQASEKMLSALLEMAGEIQSPTAKANLPSPVRGRGEGGEGSLPAVKVVSLRRVFHNGEHNAFTDLVRFQGKFYLTFRSCPDGHNVHPTASIIVLASDDAREWRQVHRFHVAERDTRDPHFLVFQGKLFVYTGTWYSGTTMLAFKDYDLNKHLGYAAWSKDGVTWQGPMMLEGTFGHYIWRAGAFGDKAYLCGRRKIGFAIGPRGEGRDVQSLMLESDDGLIWRKRATFQEIAGDETAFLFEPDGSVLAIGRRGGDHAQLLRSRPPYAHWERKDLDRYIGGPLVVKWGDRYVVAGRKVTKEHGPKTSLCWLADDRLHEFAELPSGGDNSYPGFVETGPGRALVSYYSSHERDASGKEMTAIYLAELAIDDR